MEEFKVREYQGQIYEEQMYQYQDTFREEQKMEEIPINPLEGFEDLMPKNQQIKPNILPPLEDIMDEEIFKYYRNLCGRIRRMLISSCKTLKGKIQQW